MDFSNKYISSSDSLVDNSDKKIVLSNDAYAIGEMISELIKTLNVLKHSFVK